MSGSSFTLGSASQDRAKHIRDLNDEFREAGPAPLRNDRWVYTRGIDQLGPSFLSSLVWSVRRFTAFDDDNDPYGEHDFGAVTVMNEQCFWKIDYYDTGLEAGSPKPADASLTTRVLTLMLASEY